MITSVELKTTDTLVITYTLKGDTPAGSLDMVRLQTLIVSLCDAHSMHLPSVKY